MLLSELETSFANESLDGNQEEDGSNVYYAYMEHIAWLIVNHLSSGMPGMPLPIHISTEF